MEDLTNSPVDFLGNSLFVGDEVIITEPRYRNFVRGTILKLTEKYAFVKYYTGVIWPRECKQNFKQCIKINP